MAWCSAYLPADQAAGIWNSITAAARACTGPTESRTLTQLRVDAFASWWLGSSRGLTRGEDRRGRFCPGRGLSCRQDFRPQITEPTGPVPTGGYLARSWPRPRVCAGGSWPVR